ncbi:MAG: keto-deoxy-phosphogluconate aldolase [Roseibacillus sp.]|nr:keto-deoxy-phosphogluconate aldolase [Roseibacillus sp.]|tara:strand:- start:347 stop:1006 length:660 start_codon:yes stop_codon:yes gene_type:complete
MKEQEIHPVFRQLGGCGIASVVTIDSPAHAVPLAKALLAGGISAMELTLRSAGALECLRRIVEEVPGMLAGAGTILSVSQVEEVLAAGAAFGVAPGTNINVLRAARDEGLPFAPGVATPSDIELALDFDCRVLKFFPAEAIGGLRYLKNIAVPYRHLGVRYIPLGGVSPENLISYSSSPDVLAVGGSWLAPRVLVENGDWAAIEQLARQAVELVKGTTE